jgi:hypothetical protein
METPQRENNFKSYRIANGKIAIGREQDGTLEELDAIAGFLIRVGYHEEEYDGERIGYMECDLELKDGSKCRVKSKVGLNGQASQVGPVGLALGLLDCNLNDDIGIFPKLSAKPDPKFGKFSTYVNVAVINPSSGRYKDVGRDRADYSGETSKQKWASVLDDIRKHECYAERPQFDKEEKGEIDLSIFSKIDTDKRWPSPFGKAKATYLQGLADMAGIAGIYEDYAEVPQNVVNGFAEAYNGSTFDDVPENLQPFLSTTASEDKPKAFGKRAI